MEIDGFDPTIFEPRLNRFITRKPTPRQAAFLMLECLEAFYGGAGGGGKSEALLMAALQYADVPGYNGIIIRRSIADLAMPNALMNRAHAWLGGRNDTQWDESKKRWAFASGATLSFGYLDNARDGDRYASAEFHFIGFDELTQFTEKQYLDLFARLRAPICPRCQFDQKHLLHSAVHGDLDRSCPTCFELERGHTNTIHGELVHLPQAHVPLRMRSASNPGNVGHEWVKRRFVTRQGAPLGDRLFVPARLDDNPHIEREQYTQSLLQLDPLTRARILEGDWEARSMRGVLKREWFEIVEAVPADLTIIRYWDTAFQKNRTSDYTVGLKYGIGRNGLGYILQVARAKASPHEVETFISNTASQDSRNIRVILQQEPGSGSALWIDSMQRGALRGYAVYPDQIKGSKFERSQPFRAAAEAGNIKLLRGTWNDEFLAECEQFSPDEREYEHDDQIDAACGAFNYLTAPEKYEYIPVHTPSWEERHSRDDSDDRHYFSKSRRFRGRGCW